MSLPDLLPRVLYRDALMLVIDKPAGFPVHAGPGGGPNLEQGFGALTFGLPRLPALAHRLDRDTSGCLVLGRHAKALSRLGRLFTQGRVAKTYWAVTRGGPVGEEGLIELPLRRRDRHQGWLMEPHPEGQPAATRWRVLGRGEGSHGPEAWLALEPLTGRTHQIRVHLAALGCPVLGDPFYGGAVPDGPPLQLHARAISLPLYPARAPVGATAPVPPHLTAALARAGWRGEGSEPGADAAPPATG